MKRELNKKGIMMIKNLTIGILVATLLISCNNANNQEKTSSTKVAQKEISPENIVSQSLTDGKGNTLEMVFNNSNGIASLKYKGENIELKQQKAASGIWYKNKEYELRGKGNDLRLTKNGAVVFEHKDQRVSVEARNDSGDVLNMTFNNTAGTVKVYLNGGKQIELQEEKAASGVWYKNENYELSGKGDHYELLRDGKIVFEN